MTFHALRLENLALNVHLGCLPEERSARQEVRVTIEIRFSKPPAAVQSDDLAETVCYSEISEAVRKTCEAREYHLIERMAGEIYAITREITGPMEYAEIGVSVHKVRPPVPGLLGGSHYRCGDFAT